MPFHAPFRSLLLCRGSLSFCLFMPLFDPCFCVVGVCHFAFSCPFSIPAFVSWEFVILPFHAPFRSLLVCRGSLSFCLFMPLFDPCLCVVGVCHFAFSCPFSIPACVSWEFVILPFHAPFRSLLVCRGSLSFCLFMPLFDPCLCVVGVCHFAFSCPFSIPAFVSWEFVRSVDCDCRANMF